MRPISNSDNPLWVKEISEVQIQIQPSFIP